MARILLTATRSFYRPTNANFHYGLLALGSYIKKNSNHQVELLDGSIYTYREYLEILEQKAGFSDIVGFSMMTPQVGDTYKSILHLRNKGLKTVIVVGGHHVTLYPWQTIKSELIDFAVAGDGEKGFLGLCNALASGEKANNIANVLTKDNVAEVIKKPFETLPYEELYDADYDIIDPGIMKALKRQFCYLTGRGCMFKCTFCYNSAVGNTWRCKPASVVIEEVERLYEKYKFEKLYFRDEYFFADRDRVVAILSELAKKKYPFSWITTCRASDFRKKIDKEIFELLVASRCEELRFGAESGSDRCLKFLKKGITVEDTLLAAKMCAEYGIRGSFSFLSGYPTETHEERIETVGLIDKIKKISRQHIILGPFAYYIYPGGSLYEMIAEKKEWSIEFPLSLEGWATSKYGNMFEQQSEPERFAWLDEPDFVKYFWYIIFFRYTDDHFRGFSRTRAVLLKILLSPWIVSTRIRWKFLYFGNLYDYRIYEWLDMRRRSIKRFLLNLVRSWK